jgi:hypothetical protein
MKESQSQQRQETQVTLEDIFETIQYEVDAGKMTENEAESLRLALLRKGGHIKVGKVEDFSIQRVTSVNSAEEILNRHDALSDVPRTARALYEAMHGRPEKWDVQASKLSSEGGFFETYNLPIVQERIRSKYFIILQASGRFLNKKTLELEPLKNVADIQIQLPEDDPQTELTAKLSVLEGERSLRPGDSEESRRITAEIMANRAIAGCIVDVGVNRDDCSYGSYELVPLLQDKALRIIHNEINPTRKNAIKYLIAQFFRIEGIKVPSEDKELTVGNPWPIINMRSYSKHMCINGIETVGLPPIPASDMPVTFEYEGKTIDAALKMGWSSVAIEIDKIIKFGCLPYNSPFAFDGAHKEYVKSLQGK